MTNTSYFPTTLVPLALAALATISAISFDATEEQIVQHFRYYTRNFSLFEARGVCTVSTI
jgi:hypothetical protein